MAVCAWTKIGDVKEENVVFGSWLEGTLGFCSVVTEALGGDERRYSVRVQVAN